MNIHSNINIHRRRLLAALSLAPLATAGRTLAQDRWPSRPVRLVVPGGPGSGLDMFARRFTEFAGKNLSATFIVDNKPGANGVLAQEGVYNQPADGHTLLLTYASAMNGTAVMRPKIGRSAVSDFTPIGRLGNGGGNALVVNPKLPVHDVAGLLAYAKAHRIDYGTWGHGSGGHLTMEALKARTGMQATHIPYKSATDVPLALIGGDIPVAWTDPLAPLEFAKAGKLRIIAVSSSGRMPALPEVPTLIEQGFPVKVEGWYGLFGPRNLPPVVVTQLNEVLNRWLALPEIVEFFKTSQNWPAPQPLSPDQFAVALKDDLSVWKQLMVDAKIEPET